jgi:hypothetical protein
MNIHGNCSKCNTSFDGDLVTDYPRSQGKTEEECLEYAKSYSGWEQHGVNNRWDKRIAVYDIDRDFTI